MNVTLQLSKKYFYVYNAYSNKISYRVPNSKGSLVAAVNLQAKL